MRHYLQSPSGQRVTFEVSGEQVRISHGGGAEYTLSREGARVEWASMVREGAKKVDCRDEDGHDGEACTCEAEDPGPDPETPKLVDLREPPVGTWASVARSLAKHGLMTGDEADRWKDQMKEGGY